MVIDTQTDGTELGVRRGMVAHVGNLSTWEVEVGGPLLVQGHRDR